MELYRIVLCGAWWHWVELVVCWRLAVECITEYYFLLSGYCKAWRGVSAQMNKPVVDGIRRINIGPLGRTLSILMPMVYFITWLRCTHSDCVTVWVTHSDSGSCDNVLPWCSQIQYAKNWIFCWFAIVNQSVTIPATKNQTQVCRTGDWGWGLVGIR
jgi:hypothetical protein